MEKLTKSIDSRARRRLLQGAFGMAAAATVATPAIAKVVQPHKFRLRLEGDVNLAWVHGLYMPPIALPPGTAGRLRIESGSGSSAQDRARTLVYVFVAPAGVPPGEPAPELAPVSRSYVDTESVVLSVAQFGELATRPAKNLVMSGKFISNEVVSPFGLLTGRVAFTAFGFDWVADDSDVATFKLVTVGAAGSHVTVVPEAGGELSFH
jgi:hypothetical protein